MIKSTEKQGVPMIDTKMIIVDTMVLSHINFSLAPFVLQATGRIKLVINAL